MSHFLYEKVTEDPSHKAYQRQREAKLPSKIKSFVLERGINLGGWHMTEEQLLRLCDVEPSSNALIVDLKPKATNIVNLYSMRGIIGYSYEDWTPLCFLLEEMFADKPEYDPAGFKEKFLFSPDSSLRRAASFVYLRAGTQRGVWNWGAVGRVNGAIIFPDAWKYFHQQLTSTGWLREESN